MDCRKAWKRRLKLMPKRAASKLGKLAQPLRAALTGTTTSPGIFDVLEVLGREEVTSADQGSA